MEAGESVVDAFAPRVGPVGLEVATTLLMQPGRAGEVRELARRLGRSRRKVAAVLAALRRAELIDATNQVEGSGLFWLVADRWPAARFHLANAPLVGDAHLRKPLRLGLGDVGQPGWALTDAAAAWAYGAPPSVRSGQVLDFFVPDPSVVRRAKRLLCTPRSVLEAKATVRVAPVPAVVHLRVDRGRDLLEWPLAHPVFVALDLAQDGDRGRELLDAWTPDGRWTRVW